ncbi:hypothetical protein [Afipia broomeae]|uniref:Uncharacterized protein n=1 Tax=Afipia broomeae ATCC 49717 TaxID=883078 RepID=K8PV92_9BRAD|nr:hypothetical protein [Afipia broomeae]EKS42268.1 hypothetical protein HMPREF9695_01360 [Afipia broomeae ATCC 49717]
MPLVKIAIAAIAVLAAYATSASADVRYAGSPKFGGYYVSNSPMSARAQMLPESRASSSVPVATSKPYMRQGGINSRGI